MTTNIANFAKQAGNPLTVVTVGDELPAGSSPCRIA